MVYLAASSNLVGERGRRVSSGEKGPLPNISTLSTDIAQDPRKNGIRGKIKGAVKVPIDPGSDYTLALKALKLCIIGGLVRLVIGSAEASHEPFR